MLSRSIWPVRYCPLPLLYDYRWPPLLQRREAVGFASVGLVLLCNVPGIGHGATQIVHSRERFIGLSRNFDLREADEIVLASERSALPVAYTGYVAQQNKPDAGKIPRLLDVGAKAASDSRKQRQWTVSDRPDAPGEHVARCASLARSIPHEFHFFAGPLMPEETYNSLQTLAAASGNVRLSRYTPDLAAVLKRAELSVSMGGYNTVMDILSAGVRALSIQLPPMGIRSNLCVQRSWREWESWT